MTVDADPALSAGFQLDLEKFLLQGGAMALKVTRAEVVPTGLVVLFNDGRQALLESEEVLTAAKEADAFNRNKKLQLDQHANSLTLAGRLLASWYSLDG